MAQRLFSAERFGAMGEQFVLWGVLMQIANAVLDPALTPIRQELWKVHPSRVLSPEILADMVVRNVPDLGNAADEAAQSGYSANNFLRLVHNAGEPIPLQEALLAWRRGLIPESGGTVSGLDAQGNAVSLPGVSLDQVIRESRLKDKYIPVIKGLQWVPLGAAEWIAAWVRGQVSEAQALEGARIAGTTAEHARIMFDTLGRPPGPAELLELTRRGVIPREGTGPGVLSLQQGIYEGDQKNKWLPAYYALLEYKPPPRVTTALLRHGSLTQARALELFKDAGLSEEMAAVYVADASHVKTAATKELAKGEVIAAYKDRLLDREGAAARLVRWGLVTAEADLELALADFQVANAKIKQALGKLHTLYVNHRLTAEDAKSALDALKLPAAGRDEYLATWEIERRANVKLLTPAEIAAAIHLGLIEVGAGLARLVGLGYDDADAYIFLAVHKIDLAGIPMPPGVVPAGP